MKTYHKGVFKPLWANASATLYMAKRITTLFIEDEEYQTLRKLLKYRELSISAWIRLKIREELDNYGKQ
jgi:hypothetical protein